MLRYVLLKAPVLAFTVTSARLNPGASSPSPPPTSDSGRQTAATPPPPLPSQCGAPAGLSGAHEIKGSLHVRTDWRFRMMTLCAHTSLPSFGPAAPPGGDRFREVEGRSKVAQHIRWTQPCRLGPPHAPMQTQDQADGSPQLVMLSPPASTGSALLSQALGFHPGARRKAPPSRYVWWRSAPSLFLMGGPVPYQGAR